MIFFSIIKSEILLQNNTGLQFILRPSMYVLEVLDLTIFRMVTQANKHLTSNSGLLLRADIQYRKTTKSFTAQEYNVNYTQ